MNLKTKPKQNLVGQHKKYKISESNIKTTESGLYFSGSYAFYEHLNLCYSLNKSLATSIIHLSRYKKTNFLTKMAGEINANPFKHLDTDHPTNFGLGFTLLSRVHTTYSILSLSILVTIQKI